MYKSSGAEVALTTPLSVCFSVSAFQCLHGCPATPGDERPRGRNGDQKNAVGSPYLIPST